LKENTKITGQWENQCKWQGSVYFLLVPNVFSRKIKYENIDIFLLEKFVFSFLILRKFLVEHCKVRLYITCIFFTFCKFFSMKSDYSTFKKNQQKHTSLPILLNLKFKWSFHKSKRIICLCSINFFILQTDARHVFHYAVSHCFRLLMLTINLILYGPIGNNPLF
jgi:hypothetical protein